MRLMDIGIFSGSFNPIHVGHLALANYLCEFEGLDEVWFLVTPRNPFKVGQKLLPDDLRLELVGLAIEGYPKFRVSDLEFHLSRPSYTIHTLQRLHELYPTDRFHLIIGSDNWLSFPHWYKSEEILASSDVLVYPRPGYPVESAEELPEHVRITASPVLDISATFIRQSMDEGKDIRYFLHPRVYERLLQFKEE